MNDYWGNQVLREYSLNLEHNLLGSKVLFIVGSLSISGGTNLILEYAHALEKSGAEVHIAYILGDAKDAEWHHHGAEFIYHSVNSIGNVFFDLVIATWWRSVYELAKVNFSRVLYFVQSLESRFALNYNDIESETLAAATYMANLPMVTVASWLQNVLITATNRPVWYVRNGIDKSIFPLTESPREVNENGRLRLLLEGVPGVPMKAVNETFDACRQVSGIDIWHVTPESGSGLTLADKILEKVPLQDMGGVYQEVDFIVKMSRVEGMFGPPLEAFHSGATAVVSKVTGYDEYILDGENSLTVEVDDFQSLVEKIKRLNGDRAELARLQRGAFETASNWPDIRETARHFVGICFTALALPQNQNDIKYFLESVYANLKEDLRKSIDPRQRYPLVLVSQNH